MTSFRMHAPTACIRGFPAANIYDAPQAKTDAWYQAAMADLRLVVQVLDQASDGSWHEGIGYQSYGMSRLMPFLEMVRSLKAEDRTDFANALSGNGWTAQPPPCPAP